jgi:hypothetical protein
MIWMCLNIGFFKPPTGSVNEKFMAMKQQISPKLAQARNFGHNDDHKGHKTT